MEKDTEMVAGFGGSWLAGGVELPPEGEPELAEPEPEVPEDWDPCAEEAPVLELSAEVESADCEPSLLASSVCESESTLLDADEEASVSEPLAVSDIEPSAVFVCTAVVSLL